MSRSAMLQMEGQLLHLAGHAGDEIAAEQARALIDGAFNALIRLEGKEGAAEYAFALTDRVTGGLKHPTPWGPELRAPAPAVEPLSLPATPPPPAKSPLWTVVTAAVMRCMPR